MDSIVSGQGKLLAEEVERVWEEILSEKENVPEVDTKVPEDDDPSLWIEQEDNGEDIFEELQKEFGEIGPRRPRSPYPEEIDPDYIPDGQAEWMEMEYRKNK